MSLQRSANPLLSTVESMVNEASGGGLEFSSNTFSDTVSHLKFLVSKVACLRVGMLPCLSGDEDFPLRNRSKSEKNLSIRTI